MGGRVSEAAMSDHLGCLVGMKTLSYLQVGKLSPGTKATMLSSLPDNCEIVEDTAHSFNPDATVRSMDNSGLDWP